MLMASKFISTAWLFFFFCWPKAAALIYVSNQLEATIKFNENYTERQQRVADRIPTAYCDLS